MGVALVVIGVLALVAAVPVGIVALTRRMMHRPAKRTARAAGGLTAGGLALSMIGAAVSATPAATTTADPPTQAAATAAATVSASGPPSSAPAAVTTSPPAPGGTAPTTRSPAVTAPTPPPPVVPTTPAAPARDLVELAAESGPAAAALLTLPVKGPALATGYSRDQFGQAWADVDGNGCDTRDGVPRRDLTATRVAAGTGGCRVAAGTLIDPYSGATIGFTDGASASSGVQIDHVVALSNAWQTGAFAWPATTREQFANDPLNLLAVQGRLNNQESDGDAATWLPPATSARCD